MGKANVKERRTRILLALYLLNKEKAHNLFSGNIKHIFSLPSDSPRSRGTFRQMLLDAVIEKEDVGIYQITKEGITELSLTFPYIRFTTELWDGKYYIVSYEIPERKRKLRDSFRREVSGWGFGPWHRSFWITPHPILENLKKLTKGSLSEEYIQAFEAAPVLGEKKILIEKVWGLKSLEEAYKKLFKDWHSILSEESLSKEDKMKKVVETYIEVLKNDPGLPKEVVGEKWIGFEAFGIFEEMRTILL